MDIKRLRGDTAGCEEQLFMNSAGSSLPPSSVNKRIIAYLKEEEAKGGYNLQFSSQHLFDEFYCQIAKLMHCNSRNIAFASSATDAYGKALSSIRFEKDDLILTSDGDYVSNYFQFINLKERYGIRIERMGLLENGDLDLRSIEKQILEWQPKLVALAHIPTNSGLVQDASAIGKMCKSEKYIYLVDACQSVGQMDVDVQQLNCDFLTVTGRKFLRGPRGTGFLYASDEMLDNGMRPITMDGVGGVWTEALDYTLEYSAKRFELWEKPFANLLGFTEAIRYANEIGMVKIEERNTLLMSRLRSNLQNTDGVMLLDKGSRLSNILTFRKEGVSMQRTQSHFKEHKLTCGFGTRSQAVIDYDKKGIEWLVRISPHYFNTLEEMNKVTEIIDAL